MGEGMTCWEDDTTGCVCGNDCVPPQWMQDMWAKERE